MKTKPLLLLLLFIAGAITASAQSQENAEALCRRNPSWKQKDCERVAKKEIWIGMTDLMLLDSQGSPARKKKIMTAAGTAQLWVYEKETGTAFRTVTNRQGQSLRLCMAGCKTEVLYVHIDATARVDSIEY